MPDPALADRIAQLDDDELLLMLTRNVGQYRGEAVALGKDEARRRGLALTPPPEPEHEIMSNSEPVTIATFWDVRQAEFARSVLEGSGIDAFVQQPFTASIAPHYMIGAGGVHLMVAGADAERALEVLASAQDENAPQAGG